MSVAGTSHADALAARACEAHELLGSLSGTLNRANSPERLARNSLGVNTYGWTQKPYSDDAFRTWNRILKRRPDDAAALHHLAIMNHAKAFDLENGPGPEAANPFWEKALDCWHKLLANEDFWGRMASGLDGRPRRDEILADLKRYWPCRLLLVHYGIAFDPETASQRRRNWHVRLALDSPFDDAAKEEARRLAYERHIAGVNPDVWHPDTLDPEVVTEGAGVIESFLENDPRCVCALSDLLRLASRLARAWVQQINALAGDDPERDGVIGQFQRASGNWGPYFEQLLAIVETLDEDVRQNLFFWWRITGDAHKAIHAFTEAAGYYENARLAAQDPDDLALVDAKMGEALALNAREIASSHDPEEERRAKRLCDEVRAREGLSISAHAYLANAYMLVHEFDAAEEVCNEGLEIEPELTPEALESAEAEKHILRDLLDAIARQRALWKAKSLLGEAEELMEQRNFAEACARLGEAVELAPEMPPLFFLRAQCHLALLNPARARADLGRLVELDSGDAARQAAGKLEEQCAREERDVGKFGREALLLRREANEAFGAGDFEGAERMLRQALETVKRPGRQDIRTELAITLLRTAVKSVNETMESQEVDAKALRRQKARLEEARKLAPDMEEIRENLDRLNGILEKTELQERMEGEYGGRLPFEAHLEAVRAYNNGNHDAAIRKLRQAINAFPHSVKLKEELSEILTSRAIGLINEAEGAPPEATMRSAQDMLTEALEVNSANFRARENQRILNDMMEAVERRNRIADDFGGEEAARLRMEAVEAFNNDNLERAESRLRDALRVSIRPQKIEEELSMVLTAKAIQVVNAVNNPDMLRSLGSPSAVRQVFQKARDMLEEAIRLDSTNAKAHENLAILQALLERL